MNKKITILLLTLITLSKSEGNNFIYKIKGMDDSVSPQKQIKGFMRLSYWTPFNVEYRCDAIEIRLYLSNRKQYHIKKLKLGGPDKSCNRPKAWGGDWKVRKMNGYYSFFTGYDIGDSVSSNFQYDVEKYKWNQNNNTLITTQGIELPGIIFVKPDDILKTKIYYPEITFVITIPLALTLLLSDFVVMITYFCIKRKGAVPSYSIMNLITQTIVILLITKRFTEDNTLFFFWPVMFPLIMMIVAIVINLSDSKSRTKRIKSATFIFQALMITSIALFPIALPYIAPFGIGLVGFECKTSSKNRTHAKKIAFLQILTCSAIWIYLAYPGTPADINVSGLLSLVPLTVFFVNVVGMKALIKKSEHFTDTPVVVVRNPLTYEHDGIGEVEVMEGGEQGNVYAKVD